VAVKRYGWERAREEWRVWSLTLAAVVISLVVLECLMWATEEGEETEPLRATEGTALRVLGIHAVVALSYTIWRKRAPAESAAESPAEGPAEGR
jgi:hypothetical protein